MEKKRCPICGAALISFHSLFMRKCSGCGAVYEWKLGKNQEPLHKYTR